MVTFVTFVLHRERDSCNVLPVTYSNNPAADAAAYDEELAQRGFLDAPEDETPECERCPGEPAATWEAGWLCIKCCHALECGVTTTQQEAA